MAFVVGATAAACSSEPGKVAGPPTQSIDVSQLDVGNYPTSPRPQLGMAGSPAAGATIEGQRMADYVVGPWEVDPSLVDGGHRLATTGDGYVASAGVLRLPVPGTKDPEPILWVKRAESAAITDRHPFIVGFHTVRYVSNNRNKGLTNDVLRFADEHAAAGAAAELGEAIQRGSEAGRPVTAVAIPGHPDAVAATHRYDDESNHGVVNLPGSQSPDSIRKYIAVRSTVVHGPYVLMQEARSPEGVDAALAMVAKAIDLQSALIDKFPATDPAKLADTQIDPSGLLVRTLPVKSEDYSVDHDTIAVYAPRGALHFQREPVRRSAAMTDAGVDLVANAKGTVFQARDNAAAAGMVDAIADTVAADASRSEPAKPMAPIKGLKDSRCLEFADGQMSYCVAAADRYLVEATRPNLLDAQQLVAAQVVMLLGERQ